MLSLNEHQTEKMTMMKKQVMRCGFDESKK